MLSQIHKLEQGSKTVHEMENRESNPKLLCSSIPVFDFKHHCFLSCGPVVIDLRHSKNSSVRDVITVEMEDKCWKVQRKDGCLGNSSQRTFVSVCRFACCWCILSHKLPSWFLEWATMFQSKRTIQHNWFGTWSPRTSEEGWCFS